MCTILKLASILLILFTISCSNYVIDDGPLQNLYGAWIKPEYDTALKSYVIQKSSGLDSNEFGFIFYRNGNYISRDNAGWCATPPISFRNYEGKWERDKDGNIDIEVAFWGGIQMYKIAIIDLNSKIMKYRILKR